MQDDSDSVPRRAGDYLLFAIAFGGFGLAGVGVIVSSAATAFTGVMILLLALLGLLGRSEPAE
jgi:hypothetical protein